ncbi:MAG TPA: DMT family transporter [Candidatus Dormibacteraeota bacterium]|nr:DMT family transporter [Candidatus Dormibacteraeota bacterium]
MNEQQSALAASTALAAELHAVIIDESTRGFRHIVSKLRRIVRSRLLIYLALLYVVFCWALNTVLVKQVVELIDPLAFTFMRFLIMTPLAFGLVYASGERLHVERRDWPMLLLCGACGYGAYQYFWIIGLAHTTAFASALLGAFAPVFTLSIVALAGLERVRSGRWLGTVIALAGIAIYEGVFAGAARFQLGDTLTLMGALVFAGYNVVSARLLKRYSPLTLLAITMAIGAVMIAPGGIVALSHTHVDRLGWYVWSRFIFATLFPILLTYPVWSWGIARIGAGRVSLFSFLTPVLAGALSIPILHTKFTPYQVLGAIVCLGGMALANILGRVSFTDWWAQRTLPFER